MSVVERIAAAIGEGSVLTGPADTAPFFQDWHGRTRGEARCVALPRGTEEVAAIVRICREAGEPVFPQGGNTSVCGGSVPLPGGRGVLLSLARMNRLRAIDRANNSMIVESGCVLAAVHEHAASVDRLFPLTLGAQGSCQIGGNIATNAGGTAVLRYGNMREQVLGLEVVLADGRVWDGLRTLRKDNTGYDLKGIFVGSEGTLGIVTAAALRLHPRPRAIVTGWVGLDDPAAALDLLGRIQETFDAKLVGFELISGPLVRLVTRYVPGTRAPLEGEHPWQVLIELNDMHDRDGLQASLEDLLGTALEAGTIRDAVVARSEAQAAAMWQVRHGVTEANRSHGLNVTHDVSVPVSQVPAFFAKADALFARERPEGEILSVTHLGDGNVHYTVTVPHPRAAAIADPAGLAASITAHVHDIAVGLGGSFIAEHGVGQRYRRSLLRYKAAVELDLFRSFKKALDPDGLFNPGKVLPDEDV